MELEIIRTYHPNGTNGVLYIHNDSSIQCYTIELPWEHNLPNHSCIPEGRYELKKRYSTKFKKHLLVEGVKDRALILIHPANSALKELRGCIAPVSILKGPGKGILSRNAFEKIITLVYKALQTEPVYLTIKSSKDESKAKNRSAHP